MSMRSRKAAIATPDPVRAEIPAAPKRVKLARRHSGSGLVQHVLETSHARLSICETRKDGFPVVLLHGNSSCKEVFRNQLSGAIANRFRMIAIDLPGHGASGDAHDPDRTYTYSGYADAVAEALELMGIDRMAMVGWSLGGHVGIEYMASVPGLAGLMIVGTPPVAPTLESMQAGFQLNPGLMLLGKPELTVDEIAALGQLTGTGEDQAVSAAMRRADGRARARVFADIMTGQVSDQKLAVETTSVPVAMVVGAQDPIVNPAYLTGLAGAHSWGSQCYVLPQSGHAPFLDTPVLFNEILNRFAADMEQRTETGLPWASTCLSG